MSAQREWSTKSLVVWAKSGGFDGERPMSLPQHLEDSAAIAPAVWRWLPPLVRHTIERALPEGASDGETLVCWLAGVHDIGKASAPFASQVPVLAERMRDAGFVFPSLLRPREAPHATVGQLLLERWLEGAYDANHRAATTYAVVVGGHHGVPPSASDLERLDDRRVLGTGLWTEAQREILDGMAARTGADRYLASWAQHPLSVQAQALLSGAVIVCDWLASNEDLFPLQPESGVDRATAAWNHLDLPPPWNPRGSTSDTAHLFAERFPHLGAPRPFQEGVVAAARAMDSPGLLVVEAGMGSGKTEAALLAAELLAARFDCGGIYLALPTMATSDGMFGRVLDWTDRLDLDHAASTFLAHSKAQLNDDYRGLFRPGPVSTIHDDDPRTPVNGAEVRSWLSGRKKGVLASMVVGTIDQVLIMALQAKHASLRHLALAGKVVVIDEAHANDDFMRVFLCRALEWLASYDVPVVLLSATLPSAQREDLVNAYRAGRSLDPVSLAARPGYPCLTTATDAAASTQRLLSEAGSTTVTVTTAEDDDAAVADLLADLLVDGGCAAVIRNTVARAQATAQAMRERFGDDVVLVHSRFLARDRARREAALREALGRDGTRPPRLIVIGTQVLEQSLDVDFDVMVSDVAPVDLVLQRVGRLHRHQRDRPTRLREPHLHLTGVTAWRDDGPVLDRGSLAVYRPSRLLRSLGTLGLHHPGSVSLRLPDDIQGLVETAYGADPAVPDAWLSRTRSADLKDRTQLEAARSKAQAFLMRAPRETQGNLVGWLQHGRQEAELSEGSARVRDSDDSIEVIVARRTEDGLRFVVPADDDLATEVISTLGLAAPTDDQARALATCTVRLPAQLTRQGQFDATLDDLERNVFEGFQQSRWLKGQLVMVLDDDLSAVVGGHRLTYDPDLGLTATAIDKEAA